MDFENIITDTIAFQHNGEKIRVAFSVCVCLPAREDNNGFNQDSLFLSPREKKLMGTFIHERKQRQFLLGRYAAKAAIGKLINSQNYHQIIINNGILGQPIVTTESVFKGDENIHISISHSNYKGAALAYPPKIIMGTDIEKIDPDREKLILEIITEAEKKIVYKNTDDIHNLLTLMWSAREALSKCIYTGLTVPLEYFEIKNVVIDQNLYFGEFKNFIQYQFIGVKLRSYYIITFVYPKIMIMDASSVQLLKSLGNMVLPNRHEVM